MTNKKTTISETIAMVLGLATAVGFVFPFVGLLGASMTMASLLDHLKLCVIMGGVPLCMLLAHVWLYRRRYRKMMANQAAGPKGQTQTESEAGQTT